MAKPAPKPIQKEDGVTTVPNNESAPSGPATVEPAKIDPARIEQIMAEWAENCVQAGAVPLALVAVVPGNPGSPAKLFSALAKTLPVEIIAGVITTVGLSLKNQARGAKITTLTVPAEIAEKAVDFPTER